MKTIIFLLISSIISTIDKTIESDILQEEVILKNTINRPFSNPDADDIFTLSIIGHDIINGKMVFQILDSNGMEIFKEEYPSIYLIGYGLEINASAEKQENFIRQRVADFFNNESFFDMAIAPDEEFDMDYTNEADWNDIKSDSSAIGFYYLIGEEAGCRIAYSKKQKKVIKYFCCC